MRSRRLCASSKGGINIKSSIEVGKALKIMAERLEKLNIEMKDPPCKHICTTCKYRMTETYITQDWGIEQV